MSVTIKQLRGSMAMANELAGGSTMSSVEATQPARKRFMPAFECRNQCDICGKPRAFGHNTYKHTKCSKIRQAHFAALRAKESKQENAK